LGVLKRLDVLLLQRNQFSQELPFSIVNLENVTAIDLTNNKFTNSSNLPSNVCSRCERFANKCGVFSCADCKEGQLLGCQSPNRIKNRLGCNLPPQTMLVDECFYQFS
jgi:hypothetical protein